MPNINIHHTNTTNFNNMYDAASGSVNVGLPASAALTNGQPLFDNMMRQVQAGKCSIANSGITAPLVPSVFLPVYLQVLDEQVVIWHLNTALCTLNLFLYSISFLDS